MKDRTILLVDDEPDIVQLLTLYLQAEGYHIIEAFDGQAAFEQIQQHHIDLAVIDLMMPKMDGYQLLQKIRRHYTFPVLLLSAKNEEIDKITGLKLGADDYMTKPFSPLEMVARIQAQIRRSYELNINTHSQKTETTVGNVTLVHQECTLYVNGTTIPLSARAYQLLSLLMSQPGRIFTKKQIFEQAWQEHYIADDNAIMVQISRLRDKIEPFPRNPKYIKTIRGLGYRFAKEEELQ